MTATAYPADRTALLIVDPYNDFMSEGSKLYEASRETAKAVGFYDNMRKLIPAIRAARIQVIGYAMWTYLTTPFFMAMPGFQVTEISPRHEGVERWRCLRARFPDEIASHSKERIFTSMTISCCVGMTTTLMWRVVFLQRNMSTKLWRWMVSAIQPSALRTCADQI